jgi:hypothetical protein
MNKDEFSTHMASAVSTTIENMAFAEAVMSETDFIPAENSPCVMLVITEPFAGSLTMPVSKEFLAYIAEALFSVPAEEIEEVKMKDLLSELLNTIAGSFMIHTLPEDTSFKLGIPEHVPATGLSSSLSAVNWNFTVEGSSFAIIASGELIDHLEKL